MKQLSLILAFLSFSAAAGAQQFTVIDSLSQATDGAAAWGDYDNDGRKDLAYAGQSGFVHFLRVYHNTPSGFVPVTPQLPYLMAAALHWADLDNDGREDLIAAGRDSTGICKTFLYRSNGNGTFTDMTGNNIPGLMSGSIDVADYNNDGRKDIAMTGINDLGIVRLIILKGTGSFAFTDLQVAFPGAFDGEARWGDFNNDNKADLLVTGGNFLSSGPVARLYQNMGTDNFAFVNTYLKGGRGTADWVDYDNDGWKDIFLAGLDSTGTNRFAELYRNNGNSTFTVQTSNIPAFGNPGAVAVADFNGDGKADICLAGSTAFGSSHSALASGTGTATFTVQPFLPADVQNAIAEPADFDNDGDVDLLLSHYVLRNDQPSGVGAAAGGQEAVRLYPNPAASEVTVSWQAQGKGEATVELLNSTGQAVYRTKAAAQAGSQSIRVPLAHLPVGTYYLRLHSGTLHIAVPFTHIRP